MQRFQVISADPPWSFDDELKMKDGTARSAASQYNVMPLSSIKAMRVKELTDPTGAILVLWVPSTLLEGGLQVMKAWGFNFKQTYIWVKSKKGTNAKKAVETTGDLNTALAFGMGRLFRQCHEIALVGTNNNGIYKRLMNKAQRSVVLDENKGHSTKPELPQDALDLMFPNSEKLEIFARRVRPGWTCIGNEVCNGEDIHDSIARLLGEQPTTPSTEP